MDWKAQTIQTYDDSAAGLAEKFKGIGARTDDIEIALGLAQAGADARVIEIGCGDGRDAEEIVKRVGWYEGFDPSEGLLRLACQRLPETSFVKADALSYTYPNDLNVVFALASLLHVNQADFKKVCAKVAVSLVPGGIFLISLKERPEYAEVIQEDKFGARMFYYYNTELVEGIAGADFTSVNVIRKTMDHTDWFTIALRKN